MHNRRAELEFFLVFATLTGALGWLFWNVSIPLGSHGSYSLSDTMFTVPVVAVMLAARGFPWRRKLAYTLVTVMFFPFVMLMAEVTGLNAYAGSQLSQNQILPSLATMLYMAFLSTFPLAMLVLFVGRAPRLLWSKRAGGRRGRQ